MAIKPKVYRPTPVLLPVEIANRPEVQSKLMEYMHKFKVVQGILASFKTTNINHVDIGDATFPIKESSNSSISNETKIALLQHSIPLYHDVFLSNNKILATGSHFPGLDTLIGKPLLFIRNKRSIEKNPIEYFQENLTRRGRNRGIADLYSPSYIVIEDLPLDLLQNPTEWELIFLFQDFECCVTLQKNPFANATPKITLNTLQKDNPAEWISEWCNYYYHNHGVERIVIYNNGLLSPKSLPNLSVDKTIEIWYVEWPHVYQQFFTRCQHGALTHAYWWIRNAAKYFLNFDIDEYLVNDSGVPLIEYVQKTNTPGLVVNGYGIPKEIMPVNNQKGAAALKKLGTIQNSAYKYVYLENYWYRLETHKILRFSFFPKPKFWTLLETSSRSIPFIMSKYLYRISCGLFRWQGFLLKMPIASVGKLYFLHYRSRKTVWKNKSYITKR